MQCKNLVKKRARGFEPPASALGRLHSAAELHPHLLHIFFYYNTKKKSNQSKL